MVQRKLGRGLDFLLSGGSSTAQDEIVSVDIAEIRPNPFQPRREFAESELAELAASIKEHGVLQPIVVRAQGQGYQLIAGERRLRACQQVGLATVPAIVREADDTQMLELALVENIQRTDLNAIELARAYLAYMQRLDLTQEQVAERLGKSRSAVANTIRLLDLPLDLQELVSRGTLSMGHARALLGLPDAVAQRAMSDRVVSQGLSVRALEAAIQVAQAKSAPEAGAGASRVRPAHLEDLETQLKVRLGTKVSVEDRSGRGRIVIEYFTPDELNRLLDQLLR
jgi:ParB family chromosome partitioning protein